MRWPRPNPNSQCRSGRDARPGSVNRGVPVLTGTFRRRKMRGDGHASPGGGEWTSPRGCLRAARRRSHPHLRCDACDQPRTRRVPHAWRLRIILPVCAPRIEPHPVALLVAAADVWSRMDCAASADFAGRARSTPYITSSYLRGFTRTHRRRPSHLHQRLPVGPFPEWRTEYRRTCLLSASPRGMCDGPRSHRSRAVLPLPNQMGQGSACNRTECRRRTRVRNRH